MEERLAPHDQQKLCRTPIARRLLRVVVSPLLVVLLAHVGWHFCKHSQLQRSFAPSLLAALCMNAYRVSPGSMVADMSLVSQNISYLLSQEAAQINLSTLALSLSAEKGNLTRRPYPARPQSW